MYQIAECSETLEVEMRKSSHLDFEVAKHYFLRKSNLNLEMVTRMKILIHDLKKLIFILLSVSVFYVAFDMV